MGTEADYYRYLFGCWTVADKQRVDILLAKSCKHKRVYFGKYKGYKRVR